MVPFRRGLIQATYLVVMVCLAAIACVIGPLYSAMLSILYGSWRLVYTFFTGWSRVLSMVSALFLRHTLIKQKGYHFGKGHTVSAVLGRNQKEGTLTKVGKFLVTALDKIEHNHCLRAAYKAGLL